MSAEALVGSGSAGASDPPPAPPVGGSVAGGWFGSSGKEGFDGSTDMFFSFNWWGSSFWLKQDQPAVVVKA